MGVRAGGPRGDLALPCEPLGARAGQGEVLTSTPLPLPRLSVDPPSSPCLSVPPFKAGPKLSLPGSLARAAGTNPPPCPQSPCRGPLLRNSSGQHHWRAHHPAGICKAPREHLGVRRSDETPLGCKGARQGPEAHRFPKAKLTPAPTAPPGASMRSSRPHQKEPGFRAAGLANSAGVYAAGLSSLPQG